MRLIDADSLMDTVKALENMDGEYADSFTNMAGNRAIEFDRLEDYIENAPTVDADLVAHAHWIAIDEDSEGDEAGSHCWATLKCSRCGFERETEDGYIPAYCEGCGSKMNEEET